MVEVHRMDNRLLTTQEVADLLRVKVITIRRLLARGELAAVKVGRVLRFRMADIEAYLERNRFERRPAVKWDKYTEGGFHRWRITFPDGREAVDGGNYLNDADRDAGLESVLRSIGIQSTEVGDDDDTV